MNRNPYNLPVDIPDRKDITVRLNADRSKLHDPEYRNEMRLSEIEDSLTPAYGYYPTEEVTHTREIIREPVNVQAIRAQLLHNQNKLNEHIDISEKRQELKQQVKVSQGVEI